MIRAKKKNIFAVCDTEIEYAYNFMEYLMQKKNIPFEIQAFTSPEVLMDFARNNEIEILLISDKAMKEEIRNLPVRQIIILSEGVHSPGLDQYPTVYKYQSSDKVIREVMACYGVEHEVSMAQNGVIKKGNACDRNLFTDRKDAEDFLRTGARTDSRERSRSAVSEPGELFRF